MACEEALRDRRGLLGLVLLGLGSEGGAASREASISMMDIGILDSRLGARGLGIGGGRPSSSRR